MPEQLTLDVASDLDLKVAAALRCDLVSPRDFRVLTILNRHRGAASAIGSGPLAWQLNLPASENSRRIVTKAVETLRELHGIPIGGSRVPPYGYFLIETRADLEAALAPLTGELYALLRLLRALAGKREVERLYGQLDLKLDAEANGEIRGAA
jgi:hypothetical protein